MTQEAQTRVLALLREMKDDVTIVATVARGLSDGCRVPLDSMRGASNRLREAIYQIEKDLQEKV